MACYGYSYGDCKTHLNMLSTYLQDEKLMEAKYAGKNRSTSQSQFLVATTLILTLLLAASVLAVIYLSVWQQKLSPAADYTSPELVRNGTLQSYDQV